MPTSISDRTGQGEAAGRVLVLGLGYCGLAIARAAKAAGFAVDGTTGRDADVIAASGAASLDEAVVPAIEAEGIGRVAFDDADAAVRTATHLLTTAPPDASGDTVLARYQTAIAAAPALRWIGYLSTTGVYGDRAGGWVDEATAPAPGSDRARRRLAAEDAWRGLADRRAVDVFRLAGIYGPGRSAFDDLRAGRARRIDRPDHRFGRIHRDDIVQAVLAAMWQQPTQGIRIFNLADDEPATGADVVAEAAQLLGVAPPELVPYDTAALTMSPMARSFWAENRLVCSRRTQEVLGLRWRYPSYREGLRAILAEERGQGPG